MNNKYGRNLAFSIALTLTIALALACAPSRPGTWKTPEEAVQAVAAVVGTGDTARVEEIFGPGSMEMFRSGDDVSDKEDAAKVKELILEKVAFEDFDEKTRIALLGNDGWPFPIPLVLEEGRWRFDTAAGKEEIQNRRIGRNELSTLATLHAYVDAQREYFAEGRDGNPPAYAQKIMSDPGLRNGLYWEVAEGEPASPMGDLIAQATASGYGGEKQEGPAPYEGYYYRILTGQGKNAPGGEKSYLDAKGLMTGGFAMVAWPAKHGNSGVMTFVVNQRGIVFQKDLGAETGTAAAAITAYDPDETWTPTGD